MSAKIFRFLLILLILLILLAPVTWIGWGMVVLQHRQANARHRRPTPRRMDREKATAPVLKRRVAMAPGTMTMTMLFLSLGGCTQLPRISQETGVAGASHPFERVVLILNPGVLDTQKSFGKPHAGYFGDTLKQALASREVPSELVTVSRMDLDPSALAQALIRTSPTHLLRMSAVRRTTGGSDRQDTVDWLFQVDQRQALPGGGASFRNLYKFTLTGDSCVVSRWGGEEPLRQCMQALTARAIEQLLDRAFLYQVRPSQALPAPPTASEENACVRPPRELPGVARPARLRPV